MVLLSGVLVQLRYRESGEEEHVVEVVSGVQTIPKSTVLLYLNFILK